MNLSTQSLRGLLSATALIAALTVTAQMSITPAPGEVTELSELFLNFEGEWGMGSERSARITLTGPEGVELPTLKNRSTGESYRIYFEDDAVITAPGDYTLTIPAHKFEVNALGDENEETVYHYTIIESVAVPVTVDPAPGLVTSLSEFSLTFDGEWSLGSNRSAAITVTGPAEVEIPAIKSRSMGTYYAVYFEDDAELRTPGEYILTIPEGKFAVNDVDLPEISYTYVIEEGSDVPKIGYTITPVPGEYEAITDGFTIVFEAENEFSINQRLISLSGPDGEIATDVTVDASTVTILPVTDDGDAALTQPGTYTLIIGYGAVKADGEANEDPFVFEYTIASNTLWDGQYTATPADESTVESLHEISIKFVGASTVVLSETASTADMPTLYDLDNDQPVCQGMAYAHGSSMDITLNKEVTAAGTYVLIVPTTFFTVDGCQAAREVFLTYTIGNAAEAFDYTVTVTPADGSDISNDDVITVTFGGEGIASVSHDQYAWGASLPHFTNEMNAYNPTLQVVKDGMTYTMTHTWSFEVAGDYTLVIPAGYFTITNDNGQTTTNDEICVSYHVTLTSIDSIMADTDHADVYNVAGVKVLGNATITDINSLPVGIYVINGKKISIK